MNRTASIRSFILAGLLSCLSQRVAGEDYTLQMIAFTNEYPRVTPPDTATARGFGTELHVNNAGQVMFSAGWRDAAGWTHGGIYLGRPGNVVPIVGGGDTAPGSTGEKFEGGVGRRILAFGYFVSNADSEVLFPSGVYHPTPSELSYGVGLFRGTAGNYSMLTGTPGHPSKTPPVVGATVPYTGSGRLQFGGTFSIPWLSDAGIGYFMAGVNALEGPPGGVQQLVTVFQNGIFTASFGRVLITYDGAPAPGLGGDYVFYSAGSPRMGQKNGAFVLTTAVLPRGAPLSNTTLRKVYYEYRDNALTPFYIEGDPLPGLPPLAEVLGTTQPYDIRSELAAVDETGNSVLSISASLRTGIDVRQIGFWKKTRAGLTKVLQFNTDVPTGTGSTARFGPLSTTTFQRAAMGGGNIAFLGSVIRPGLPATAAVIREVDGRFEVAAIADFPVPGTGMVLSNDFSTATTQLRMNAAGELLFFVSYREPPSTVLRRAMWVYGRDLVLRRVVFVGQTFAIDGANRTVASVHPPQPNDQALTESGVTAFMLRFSDGTSAIVRGVPPGYQDPAPPAPQGPDYWFISRSGSANWHSTPVNWENTAKAPRAQAPGDADTNTARVFIPTSSPAVVLSTRPAAIGALEADGDLTLLNLLTLNSSSTFKRKLTVSGPSGGLRINNVTATGEDTTWNVGTLTLANATFRNRNRFVATTGSVVNAGGTAVFENQGLFEKTGAGEFTVNVPFRVAPATGATLREIKVSGGTLRLIGGGSFETGLDFNLRAGTVAQLAGEFSISGTTSIGSAISSLTPRPILDLGTSQQDLRLLFASGGRMELGSSGDPITFHRGTISGDGILTNWGNVTWRGGRIALGPLLSSFANRGRLEIDPDPASRRLDGYFFNSASPFPTLVPSGVVVQRGALEIDGKIYNGSTWRIARGVNLTSPSGTGEFNNSSVVVVHLEEPGTVTFDVDFVPSEVFGGGVFNIGSEFSDVRDPIALHKNATVVLRRRVAGLANGWLGQGQWVVESGGSLEFPERITAIGRNVSVTLRRGGKIPSLELQSLLGTLTISEMNFTVPGELVNGGKLDLRDRAVFTINGAFGNGGQVELRRGASLIVKGDLDSRETGRILNDGEIIVEGNALLGTYEGSGKFTLPSATSSVKFADESHVGSSPGTLAISGSASFLPTSALNMEIGGTDLDRIDLVAATGSLTFGGQLRVSVIDNFQPAASDAFVLARANTLTGAFANAPSGQRITTTDGRGSFQIFYGTGSPHGETSVVVTNWQSAPAGSPLVADQPKAQTVTAGDRVTLTVNASGSGTLNYQWQHRGVSIPGATASTYVVPSAQLQNGGGYTVAVTNALGTVSTYPATVAVNAAPPSAARLRNVSTRALIRDGNEPLIPGFVVTGTENARFLLRAIGPALNGFGVTGVLPNPQFAVKRLVGSSYVDFSANNDWGTNANVTELTTTTAAAGAFPLPAGSLDSALLLDVPPGQYTVVANDTASRTGVAMVEVYDLTAASASARLANISTRAFVGTGADVLIPGFVISHEGARTVLVRAIGPTLGSFGVGGVLADPQLTIFQRQPDGTDLPVLSNNDWSTTSDATNSARVATEVGAFALPAGSKDAALVATLSPGAYTVQVTGVGGTTGNALVEVYVVP